MGRRWFRLWIFTPIVNDPFRFGQIAAANSLSDVYAMGGVPYVAMNIVCFPIATMDVSILREILRGGLLKVRRPEPCWLADTASRTKRSNTDCRSQVLSIPTDMPLTLACALRCPYFDQAHRHRRFGHGHQRELGGM